MKKSIKPENLTNLYGNRLVDKTDPRISFRGKLDSFQSELLILINELDKNGKIKLAEDLMDILEYCREIMSAEVMEKPFKRIELIGFTLDELREISHDPTQIFGKGHMTPDRSMSKDILKLNRLRALSREVELSANTAFHEDENRIDILTAMNRLSSAIYILQCREISLESVKNQVSVNNVSEKSERKVLISADLAEKLIEYINVTELSSKYVMTPLARDILNSAMYRIKKEGNKNDDL